MDGTKLRDIPAGADADRAPAEGMAGEPGGARMAERQPAAGSNTCGPRAIWGWSPPDLPADTGLRVGFFIYWAVVFALEFSHAPHLPVRGRLSVQGVAALLGAAC